MIVWMIHSSTPVKKEISAPAVLMTHLGSEVNCDELINVDLSVMGSSVTGTIVSFVVDIKKAPPLIDMSIVQEVPGCLYALFEYGLTVHFVTYLVISN